MCCAASGTNRPHDRIADRENGLAAFLVVAAFFGWLLLRSRAAPPQGSPASVGPVSLLIKLGNKATSLEQWDGSVRVSGGELAGVEGWHFSASDSIDGRDKWRCSTRRDAVPPYADLHYTEMRPGSTPPVLFHAVGVYVTLRAAGDARVTVQTKQGEFDFPVSQITDEVMPVLGGRATVVRVPAVEKLSAPEFEDDEPAIAALPDGSIAVAWVAYRDRADRVLLRDSRAGSWTAAQEVTPGAR